MSHPLYELLKQLDADHVHYSLSRTMPDAVLVSITVVGERAEIQVFTDGHMEISRFMGSEDILGDAAYVWDFLTKQREQERAYQLLAGERKDEL